MFLNELLYNPPLYIFIPTKILKIVMKRCFEWIGSRISNKSYCITFYVANVLFIYIFCIPFEYFRDVYPV